MNSTFRTLATVSMLALAACSGGNPLDTRSEAERTAALETECRNALDELYAQAPAARNIAADAEGILVFPSVVKAGLMIGGETGNGCLIQGGSIVGHYNKSGGSLGFQAGAQSRSEVLMFMSQQALDQLQDRAGLEFGVDASAAVVDVGAGGSIDTTNLDSEVLAFIFGEEGLMASASLEGSKVTPLD